MSTIAGMRENNNADISQVRLLGAGILKAAELILAPRR